MVELVPQGHALAQLQAKGYAEKYRTDGPVHLAGVEFNRSIVGLGAQTLALQTKALHLASAADPHI